MNRDELTRRYNLANTNEWRGIREIVLNDTVKRSISLDPVMLQCTLKVINDIDNWVLAFLREKEKDKDR